MKAIVSASAEATPQFYDIDPMNIVWHGNYPRFLELGRCALMESIGYSYPEMKAHGHAWPIIEMQLRYARPLLLGRAVRITAGIVEWENTLKVNYLLTDVATGDRLTRASTTQVALELATNQTLWETPDVFREKLSPYLSR